MKIVSFVINIAVLLMILATPSTFYNDFTKLLDQCNIVFLILNLILLQITCKENTFIYSQLSLTQFIYCLFSASGFDELDIEFFRLNFLIGTNIPKEFFNFFEYYINQSTNSFRIILCARVGNDLYPENIFCRDTS